MPEYPYTTVPGKIGKLFGKIAEVGIPSKVSVKWLKTIGFSSSNDGTLLPVLKQVQFVDASGAPTSHWSSYRGGNRKQVIATGIREGYAELYHTYPDAHARSIEELSSFFGQASTAGKQAITKTISTFKGLCELADFASTQLVTTSTPSNASHEQVRVGGHQKDIVSSAGLMSVPVVHIDIQIHISADADAKQIEQIFESMSKHLFRPKTIA